MRNTHMAYMVKKRKKKKWILEFILLSIVWILVWYGLINFAEKMNNGVYEKLRTITQEQAEGKI